MNNTLKKVSEFLQSQDVLEDKKYSIITYSELIQDLINKNKTPFLVVLGMKERKSPLSWCNMDKGYRQFYDITLVICQDKKVLRDVLIKDDSIFDLWSYTWSLIETDKSFNGVVDGIEETTIESKLTTLQKDNTIKLVYETQLSLYKDVLK